MGKGRKRKDAERKAAQKWVLVYLDAYAFAEPAIVSDPMSYDDAMIALEKAKKSEGPDGFDSFEIWPAPTISSKDHHTATTRALQAV